jgi:hypothetical protein
MQSKRSIIRAAVNNTGLSPIPSKIVKSASIRIGHEGFKTDATILLHILKEDVSAHFSQNKQLLELQSILFVTNTF